jgi:hypothetical protein
VPGARLISPQKKASPVARSATSDRVLADLADAVVDLDVVPVDRDGETGQEARGDDD